MRLDYGTGWSQTTETHPDHGLDDIKINVMPILLVNFIQKRIEIILLPSPLPPLLGPLLQPLLQYTRNKPIHPLSKLLEPSPQPLQIQALKRRNEVPRVEGPNYSIQIRRDGHQVLELRRVVVALLVVAGGLQEALAHYQLGEDVARQDLEVELDVDHGVLGDGAQHVRELVCAQLLGGFDPLGGGELHLEDFAEVFRVRGYIGERHVCRCNCNYPLNEFPQH